MPSLVLLTLPQKQYIKGVKGSAKATRMLFKTSSFPLDDEPRLKTSKNRVQEEFLTTDCAAALFWAIVKSIKYY